MASLRCRLNSSSHFNIPALLCIVIMMSALISGTYSMSPVYDSDEEKDELADEQFAVEDPRERETKGNMKKLVLLALLKLAQDSRNQKAATDDERILDSDDAIENQQSEHKRGRWQGFCFRKARNGRIHPYICWKGSDM